MTRAISDIDSDLDEDKNIWIDCPKCGQSNQESDYEALHYDCTSCALSYDMIVCDSCGKMVGTYFGDGDTCPLCEDSLIIE